MKVYLFFVTILLSLTGQSCHNDSLFEEFKIERGVNISHWLSQSQRRGPERKAFFTRDDVDLIKEIGYDHIRLPVDEEQLWDENGNRNEDAFALLNEAIGWCYENGLRIIIDLHIIRSHHFNKDEKPLWTDPAEQDKLVFLWNDLSSELRKYDNGFLAYELMNEAVAEDPENWNLLLKRLIQSIREDEPERTIVVGSNMWQNVHTFRDLKIPEGDRKLLLSFHFYQPFAFTHHKASWTYIKAYDGPVHYPGMVMEEKDIENLDDELREIMKEHVVNYTRETMISEISIALEFAKEHELPLYCGEFGVYPTVDRSEMLQWYSDFRSALEENHIAWANWDYKGGFGIVNRNREKHEDLINALIPQN